MSRNLSTLDVFWTNQIQMRQNVIRKWQIRSLVNARSLQLECAMVLEKERSRNRAVQADNLRGLLGKKEIG